MKRKKIFFSLIAVLSISLVIAMALGFFSVEKNEKYNVVEIYIMNWDINATTLDDEFDVLFRISIDSDADGAYNVVRNSDIFRNTSVEVVPFKLGDSIPISESEFQFKVEVFRVVDGSLVPMRYSSNGSVPINIGSNEVYSSKAWAYDATNDEGSDDLACRISYVYYVNSLT